MNNIPHDTGTIQTQGYVAPGVTAAAEQQLNLPHVPPVPPGTEYAVGVSDMPQTGDANTPPDARVQAAFDRPIPAGEPAQPATKTFIETLGEDTWKQSLMLTQQESIVGFPIAQMDDMDILIALGYLIDVVWRQDEKIVDLSNTLEHYRQQAMHSIRQSQELQRQSPDFNGTVHGNVQPG